MQLGKRWQEKFRGPVCSSVSFLKKESLCTGDTARGVVLGQLLSLTGLELAEVEEGKGYRSQVPRR